MIISASRRTDIPAFYSDWFYKRVQEKYVFVRNPFNYYKVRKIELAFDKIDGIVFWTKNPLPMMERIEEIRAFPFYFLFTLNAYGINVERNLPGQEVRIRTFIRLSELIGRHRVIWRYDPILITEEYDFNFHLNHFSEIARQLSGYTEKCIFSFVQPYPKVIKRIGKSLIDWPQERKNQIIALMAREAQKNGIEFVSCAQRFKEIGIEPSSCIDADLISRISGKPVTFQKDRNQRKECGCAMAIDIGAYNSCLHGCIYCYAAFSQTGAQRNLSKHFPESPLLYGNVTPSDEILLENR
ncbi:MAG: DUF1848 domain-containing protein [Peptococcaceae bacterium]|nr:DUF1848 domain-containing protein [Peptococcaceae bacterium]